MADDGRVVVAQSAAARRPPDDRRTPNCRQPRHPAVAVERVADQGERPEVRRQRGGTAGRQGAVADRREAVVVEGDAL